MSAAEAGRTVGVVGLGLIGGSMAKAYHSAGCTVLCHDINRSILDYAMLAEACDAPLTPERLPDCELILVALYPSASIVWLEQAASRIRPGTLVIDCCGTKTTVCKAGFRLAQKYGFNFVGGHPMAGTEFSGFKHSRATMFKGASMVIVPPVYDDIDFFQRVKDALAPAQFGRITVSSAEEHDAMIAFTSQMPHLVSNAFIKSPTARTHKGFSAGSYKDLTRVAWLNEQMWTELFLENRTNLLQELDQLLEELKKYRDALECQDADRLKALLAEGRMLKEIVDGKRSST